MNFIEKAVDLKNSLRSAAQEFGNAKADKMNYSVKKKK